MDALSLEASLCAHAKDQVVGATTEGQQAGEELVEQTPETPDVVGQTRVRLVADAFGSHILGSAHEVDVSVPSRVIVDLHLANMPVF